MSEVNEAELRRLREDFESHASRYSDTTCSVFFIAGGQPVENLTFRKPNHAVMLWQYVGHLTTDTCDQFAAAAMAAGRFGLPGAELSAFAAIEGADTELFRRMGYRAGSLIPDQVITSLTSQIMAKVSPSDRSGKPFFAANPDPLAAWLNLVLTCMATFQPERLRRPTLAVDPFAASLTAIDHLLAHIGRASTPQGESEAPAILSRRFKVALSFPGDRRDFVSRVAVGLQKRIGDVFYDQFFEADLAQPNLDLLLQRIYHDNSDLVVVFLCEAYQEKEWCGLEWRAIRDLIKKRQGRNIMFMRFDNAEIEGLFSIDGYVDLRGRTSSEAIELIYARATQSE